MSHKTITIHISDQGNGAVSVLTTAAAPQVGARLSPAEAFAMDLLTQIAHRAIDVRYWQDTDAALDFVRSMLDPERNGWAVNEAVRDEARHVLGMQRVGTGKANTAHGAQVHP